MSSTMKDVAIKAGVSTATVSHYLSGKKKVSPIKEKQIKDAIDALGYRINVSAQSLKMHRFMYIGVIISRFENHFATALLTELDRVLKQQNYNMLVFQHGYSNDELLSSLQELSMRVDGIIILQWNRDLEKLLKKVKNLPPVTLYCADNNSYIGHKIVVNLRETAKMATTALLQNGHRNIAFFIEKNNISNTTDKLTGFQMAHETFATTYKHQFICPVENTEEDSKQSLITLLTKYPTITGVVAMTYKQTLGAIAAISELRLNEHISIIGYDCKEIATLFTPPLCYIEKSIKATAKYIGTIMTDAIENSHTTEKSEFITIIIAEKLVNEDSLPKI